MSYIWYDSCMRYLPRVVDEELTELLGGLPAILVEGPKAVGKTVTARRVCTDELLLDDSAVQVVARADPAALLADRGSPLLVDEWHLVGGVFDAVRRAVDANPSAGRFVLTGSARPEGAAAHTGAGRIVAIRMRPMTLPEREATTPKVSLAGLLNEDAAVEGRSEFGLIDYAREIAASGFPGVRTRPERFRRALLDGYLDSIVQRDIEEAGHRVRRPDALRRWLEAYAASTAAATSLEKIRNAAARGDGSAPSKQTTLNYHNALRRLWIVDELEGWPPSSSRFTTVNQAPKRYLADPALALSLLGLDSSALMRDGFLFGAMLESLAALTLRVFAQAAEGRVRHLRTRGGHREVDFIIERRDGRVLALEVKLARRIDDRDAAGLLWLKNLLGSRWIGGAVLNTGPIAYRRPDGIAVVPLALLGP